MHLFFITASDYNYILTGGNGTKQRLGRCAIILKSPDHAGKKMFHPLCHLHTGQLSMWVFDKVNQEGKTS